jgi:hypothetical protein
MLRDRRFKYVQDHNGGEEELYDLEEDPAEARNLMVRDRSSEAQAARDALRARLVEYETRWGIEGSVVDRDLSQREAFDTGSIKRSRNAQLPGWTKNLDDPDAVAALNSVEDEIRAAVAKEPTVSFEKLDLDTWAEKTGLKEVAERLRGT